MLIPADQVRTGSYGLTLTSEQNVPSLRPMPVALRQMADRHPQVKARLSGVGQLILSRAKIPIPAAIKDDYGVAKAECNYRSESP